METVTVIKHFGKPDHVVSGLFSGFIYDISDPFRFKGVKKAFNHGIIPAVILLAHAANHAVLV
jgi:hypothetical protein